MIVFTGGGSGGHSMVAITLIKYFRNRQPSIKIEYIGSHQGLEKILCLQNDVSYHEISTGKLRRYFSLENFLDVFKVLLGFLQCFFLFFTKLKKAEIVFSTGGFVSVAPCVVARVLGRKVYLHEQTSRLGLANKIISKFADKVFITFESSRVFLPKDKVIFSGYPLREDILSNSANFEVIKGVSLRDSRKPILFVTGGGNGAQVINELILKFKSELLDDYIIFHQVGSKFVTEYQKMESENYKVFDFIGEELISLIKAASVVISRAGAGSVCELMALNKKVVFIPLKIAQRNEQFHNAQEASKHIRVEIIEEDDLKGVFLPETLSALREQEVSSPLEKKNDQNPCEVIYKELSI